MSFTRIGLIGIVFTCTIWLAFCSGAVSFAQCPEEYPFDCGDGWCCLSGPDAVCDLPKIVKKIGCIKVKKGCPSEALYGENSEETELLRNFRDNVLSQTPAGQEIIKLYYEISPAVVKAMEEDEAFKQEMKGMIDEIFLLLR